MRVLIVHLALPSHFQIFKAISLLNSSECERDDSLESMVASHSPVLDRAMWVIRLGSRGVESLRETRFEGDTSISWRSVWEEGVYIWREDGWEEGRIRLCVVGWIARGGEGGVVAPNDVDGSFED
jgi:hypothetical protein